MSNKQQIIDCLEQNDISNYTLVQVQKHGYIINVEGNVNLSNKNLTSILYKFVEVTEKFDCSNNNQTFLENSPNDAQFFDCFRNPNTQSLKGAPKIVCEWYYCNECNLYTLKKAPIKVNWFICLGTYNLTFLEYGQKIVKENYSCFRCNLLTLKDVLIQVETFDCSDKNNFSSLDYAPWHISVFKYNNTNMRHCTSKLVIIKIFETNTTNIKKLIGYPTNCKVYLFSNCDLTFLDGLPKHGGYLIWLEESLNMKPANNITKNLIKFLKPIILLCRHKAHCYKHILSKLPSTIQQKTQDILLYL